MMRVTVFEINDKAKKFRIRDLTVKSRVLRRGMWNIDDIPTIVSKWSPVIEEMQP